MIKPNQLGLGSHVANAGFMVAAPTGNMVLKSSPSWLLCHAVQCRQH